MTQRAVSSSSSSSSFLLLFTLLPIIRSLSAIQASSISSLSSISASKIVSTKTRILNTKSIHPRQLQFVSLRGGGGDDDDDDGAETKKETKNKINSKIIIDDLINIDEESIRVYKAKALELHKEAVERAKEWFSWDDNTSFGKKNVNNNDIEFDVYGIKSSCRWSVPDYYNDFDSSSMIHVTKGASITPKSKRRETPMFSSEECDHVIQLAEDHFHHGPWTTLKSGRFDVAGFWIRDVPTVHAWFRHMLQTRLLPTLVKLFPSFVFDNNDDNDHANAVMNLLLDSAYMFRYTPETGRRTDVHTDSGCLSFTIALNGRDDYTGGGTWFDSLDLHDDHNNNNNDNNNNVIEMNKGHVTFRPGGVRHRGNAVTSGTRYIIGGFIMHKHRVEYVRLLTGLADLLIRNDHQYEQALDALRTAISINPNFDGLYTHLANAYENLHRPDDAKRLLEWCYQNVNPNNAEVAYCLGLHRKRVGDFVGASNCFHAALAVDHSDVDAIMAHAELCSSMNKYKEERQWWMRLLQTPDISKHTMAMAYCNIGVTLAEEEEDKNNNNNKNDEILMYQKALELVPDLYQALYCLGSVHAAQKQYEEAASYFRRAVESIKQQEEEEDRTKNHDKLMKAITSLYRVAVFIVQMEGSSGFSQEDVMKRLMEIVGKDNYQKLIVANTKK